MKRIIVALIATIFVHFCLLGQETKQAPTYQTSHVPIQFSGGSDEEFLPFHPKTTADTCLGTGGQNWFNSSASQLALPSTLSNLSFSIEGNFTVDRDLVLDNCRVKMGPNARIQVVGNARFTLLNTEISACSEMWDGIYLGTAAAYFSIENTPTGTLSPAKFQHAINGIVISNGANFHFDQAHLHNNLHHLQIKNANSIYSNTIFSSQFTCDPAGIGRAPYGQSITQKAIWISDVDSIQIGESIFTGPGLPGISTISHANNGIWVENSSLELSAFEVKDIEYCGLLAFRNNQGRKTIHTNYPNFFSNMDYGVAILGGWGRFSSYINGTNMLGIHEVGIYIFQPDNQRTECIGNNFFDIGKIGIWMNQIGNGNVDISANTLQNPFSNDNYCTGIYCSDITGNEMNSHISITSNNLNNFFTGIALLNIQNSSCSNNLIYLNTNAHPNGKGSGIWIKNGREINCAINRIESTTSTFASNKTGLFLSNSPGLKFNNSLISNIGDGIILSGMADGALILCNRISRYRRGLVANYLTTSSSNINISRTEWLPFSGSICETYSYYSSLSGVVIKHHLDSMPAKPLRNWVFPANSSPFNPFPLFYSPSGTQCNYLNMPMPEETPPISEPTENFKEILLRRPDANGSNISPHEPPIHMAPNVPNHSQIAASQLNLGQQQFNVSIHPNPSPSGPYLSYYLPEGTHGEYQVYDVLGKFLYKGVLQTGYQSHLAIPFSVAGGTYYLRAEISDGRRIVEKLVVMGE